MKLYYMQGACSFVPHVALYWANAEFDAIAVDRATIKSVDYLAKNPNGQVPCLEESDFFLSENLAILSYIQSIYPQAPLFGTDKKMVAKVYQWLSFCNTNLHPKFSRIFATSTFTDNESAQEAIRAKAIVQIIDALSIADAQLQHNDYLAGHKSIADVYLYTIMNWAAYKQIDLSAFTALSAFYQKMSTDDGITKAKAAENSA